jgi:hypothetical protein
MYAIMYAIIQLRERARLRLELGLVQWAHDASTMYP